MSNQPVGPWVYFFAGDCAQKAEGRFDRYAVEQIVPVKSESFFTGKTASLVRLETPVPLSPECSLEAEFRGVVRHLQYTTQAHRTELQARSAKEYPASNSTSAVLIPIRKSAGWWGLAQDEQQAHFHKPASRETHATIGFEFADKIYRRLYHSRYFDTLPAYDFLTYFEFPKEAAGAFKELLKGLRDVERNPEWKFVERETEIWMSR